jgi:short-subunit dehydrogenase
VGIPIEGSRVLLTGASGGIGGAIAKALHARGATIVLTGRRGGVLEEIRASLGDRAEAVVSDLASAQDVNDLIAAAGRIDILVANAALPASGTLDSFSPDQIDRAINVNLRAPIQLTKALAPAMTERGAGHLVYISSISGKIATAGSSMYSATKFGLRGFSFGMGQDLKGSGVGTTCVFPGFISDAGMWADAAMDTPPGLGTSTPEQVAAAVISGIEKDRAEIDVAPPFLKFSARLNGVAPGLVAGISRRLGGDKVATDLAARQTDKR